ncbi:AraC family transcriptional regulator [Actinoplanes sp. NPDC051494]|uniref:AraC family transcriptional regulator n=1 Tax=Actinoplanes sp. NPDC051494 TaxID=3363907 RepID=UPI00378CCE14
MDVLSEVLAVHRTGRPRSMLLGWNPPWAEQFAAPPGAMGFQAVLRDGCWLLPPAGRPVALNTGDIVFRPHGRPHALATSLDATPDPCTPAPGPAPRGSGTQLLCGAYELGTGQAHPLLRRLPECIMVTPATELRSVTALLAAELRDPGPGTGAVVPALLETMFAYLLRERLTGRHGPLVDPAVATALEALHGDPGRAWTVAQLAALAGVSRAAFARRFTARAGRPPLAYLTWWRMTLAARRLRGSADTVAAVAHAAGYANEFAFTTAFRRHHGVPPGRYRRSDAVFGDVHVGVDGHQERQVGDGEMPAQQ